MLPDQRKPALVSHALMAGMRACDAPWTMVGAAEKMAGLQEGLVAVGRAS